MDIVLVFCLIFVILSSGQSFSTDSFCSSKCPAGHHSAGKCQDGQEKCVVCKNHSFTEYENTGRRCFRCKTCMLQEKVTRPCTSTNNEECDCKDGYYYSDTTRQLCMQCNCNHCSDPNISFDYIRKCQPCQRADCQLDPECSKKCTNFSALHVPTTTSASNRTSYPSVIVVSALAGTYMPYLFLSGVVVMCVVFSGFLLHLARNNPRKQNCWGVKTDLKPHEHHGSSPTTLTFNITEEIPMMDLSHCPELSPQPPAALVCPLLSDAEHKAIRQEEQSELWPAIVLYAIIKEVPLRRFKEFLRLLSVADQQLERVELDASLGLSSMEKQYQMLRLWSQRSTANLNDIFSALHYMDLSGCAQLLQESLDKLPWRPEPKSLYESNTRTTDPCLRALMREQH